MKWEKYRGIHPEIICNYCNQKFVNGGFYHERLVSEKLPEAGTMAINVCTAKCRKDTDKIPFRITEKYFTDLSKECLEYHKKSQLTDDVKFADDVLKTVKSAAENVGMTLVNVGDN